MDSAYCPEYAMIVEHMKESPRVRDTVIRNEGRIDSMAARLESIESKIEKIEDKLNSISVSIIWKVGVLNIGTLVVGAIILRYLK